VKLVHLARKAIQVQPVRQGQQDRKALRAILGLKAQQAPQELKVQQVLPELKVQQELTVRAQLVRRVRLGLKVQRAQQVLKVRRVLQEDPQDRLARKVMWVRRDRQELLASRAQLVLLDLRA
jgi:hypothetical protein